MDKILITGCRGLALALSKEFSKDEVTLVSKSTGFDICNVTNWGYSFLNVDTVINCAYDKDGQLNVLSYFYNHWKDDKSKTIVNIGSKVINQPRIERSLDHEFWEYRFHKQALQQMHDSMLPNAKCNLQIFNFGALDTDMIAGLDIVKMDPCIAAQKAYKFINDPTIKRVDLWL